MSEEEWAAELEEDKLRLAAEFAADQSPLARAQRHAKEVEAVRDSPEVLVGLAFLKDAAGAGSLAKLSRYETTLERAMYRASGRAPDSSGTPVGQAASAGADRRLAASRRARQPPPPRTEPVEPWPPTRDRQRGLRPGLDRAPVPEALAAYPAPPVQGSPIRSTYLQAVLVVTLNNS